MGVLLNLAMVATIAIIILPIYTTSCAATIVPPGWETAKELREKHHNETITLTPIEQAARDTSDTINTGAQVVVDAAKKMEETAVEAFDILAWIAREWRNIGLGFLALLVLILVIAVLVCVCLNFRKIVDGIRGFFYFLSCCCCCGLCSRRGGSRTQSPPTPHPSPNPFATQRRLLRDIA